MTTNRCTVGGLLDLLKGYPPDTELAIATIDGIYFITGVSHVGKTMEKPVCVYIDTEVEDHI